MRFDARTAQVLRKAARGPAAIALRQARIGPGGALIAANPSASMMITGGSLGNLRREAHGFGALGASPIVGAAGSAAASTGAKIGASAIAADMGAGAWAGPIGLVVGAIIGILASGIFNKKYLDVAGANQQADAALGLFNQYKGIAGQVAGRQIGLQGMNAIWKGAMYAGLFPRNNQQLCFHNGCLKYRGQPEWIEATINGPDNAFTLGTAYQQFANGALATANQPSATGSMATTQPVYSPGAQLYARGALRGYRGGLYVRAPRFARFSGLGALGAINGVPEAVVLVDNYLIPNNTRDSPAWLPPASFLEHQLLYDVADAWLAAKHPEITTTPFIATPPPNNPTVTAPPAGTPMPAPVSVAQPVPLPGGTGPLPAPVGSVPQPLPAPVLTGGGAVTPITPQPVAVYGGGGGAYYAPPAGPTNMAPTPTAMAPAPAAAASPLPLAIIAALAAFGGR